MQDKPLFGPDAQREVFDSPFFPPKQDDRGVTKREELLANEPMLQFFSWTHLPNELKAVSYTFVEVAYTLVAQLPRNPERTGALRKLLEAKDCAVRAAIYK